MVYAILLLSWKSLNIIYCNIIWESILPILPRLKSGTQSTGGRLVGNRRCFKGNVQSVFRNMVICKGNFIKIYLFFDRYFSAVLPLQISYTDQFVWRNKVWYIMSYDIIWQAIALPCLVVVQLWSLLHPSISAKVTLGISRSPINFQLITYHALTLSWYLSSNSQGEYYIPSL